MRKRLTTLMISLLLCGAAAPAGAESSVVTIRAGTVLRGVPPRFLGANFTSFGKSGTSPADFKPCCLGPLPALGRPLLWRTPGGVLGSFFHFLSGTYADDPDPAPNGVPFDSFVKAATDRGSGLLHILNWNATDQELLNLIDYANGAVPERSGPGWSLTSYKQQDAAPKGYFP